MKQYKITTSDFRLEGDSGDPDAFMDPVELSELKRLAGINSLLETSILTQPDQEAPNSPIGTASTNLSQKRQIEKELNIKTGTPEWFRLYFARPELTGEKPVGDELPDAEENPSYMLDKNGLPNRDKVSALADKLEQQWQKEKNQAAMASKPKY